MHFVRVIKNYKKTKINLKQIKNCLPFPCDLDNKLVELMGMLHFLASVEFEEGVQTVI